MDVFYYQYFTLISNIEQYLSWSKNTLFSNYIKKNLKYWVLTWWYIYFYDIKVTQTVWLNFIFIFFLLIRFLTFLCITWYSIIFLHLSLPYSGYIFIVYIPYTKKNKKCQKEKDKLTQAYWGLLRVVYKHVLCTIYNCIICLLSVYQPNQLKIPLK